VTAPGTAATMSKPSRRHLGNDDLGDVARVAQPQHDAVADLAREAQHRRRQAGDVYRQLRALLDPQQLESRLPLLALRGRLPAQDRAHDRRVLSHLGHGPVDRLAVPAFYDRPV